MEAQPKVAISVSNLWHVQMLTALRSMPFARHSRISHTLESDRLRSRRSLHAAQNAVDSDSPPSAAFAPTRQRNRAAHASDRTADAATCATATERPAPPAHADQPSTKLRPCVLWSISSGRWTYPSSRVKYSRPRDSSARGKAGRGITSLRGNTSSMEWRIPDPRQRATTEQHVWQCFWKDHTGPISSEKLSRAT